MARSSISTLPVSTAAARSAASRSARSRSAGSDSALNSTMSRLAAASRSAGSMRLIPRGRARSVSVVMLIKVNLRLHVVEDAVLLAARHQQPGDPAAAAMLDVGFASGEAPSAQHDAAREAVGEQIGRTQLRRHRRALEAPGDPSPVPLELAGPAAG